MGQPGLISIVPRPPDGPPSPYLLLPQKFCVFVCPTSPQVHDHHVIHWIALRENLRLNPSKMVKDAPNFARIASSVSFDLTNPLSFVRSSPHYLPKALANLPLFSPPLVPSQTHQALLLPFTSVLRHHKYPVFCTKNIGNLRCFSSFRSPTTMKTPHVWPVVCCEKKMRGKMVTNCGRSRIWDCARVRSAHDLESRPTRRLPITRST